MFVVGLLTIAITLLVAWLSGDTEQVTKSEGGSPYYLIPLIVGVWLCFSPVRSALFGKKKQD